MNEERLTRAACARRASSWACGKAAELSVRPAAGQSGGGSVRRQGPRAPAGPGMGLDPTVNAFSRAISDKPGGFPGSAGDRPAESVNAKSCPCCEREFKPRRRNQHFCGDRCRFLSWAAGELVREHLAGNADGLRDMIGRLRI